MTQELWAAVDEYLEGRLLSSDLVLTRTLETSQGAGLPAIHVSPLQGQLLHLMAKAQGARRILELGTLGGYSTIWLGRALPPGGRLVSLEIDPRHAEVARANLQAAGLGQIVEVRVGPALDQLMHMVKGREPAFDLIFLDADKPPLAEYYEVAMHLARRGSIILVDNVIRQGAVASENSLEPAVQGVRRLMERVHSDARVRATAVQTVGSKGYDGFALIRVE